MRPNWVSDGREDVNESVPNEIRHRLACRTHKSPTEKVCKAKGSPATTLPGSTQRSYVSRADPTWVEAGDLESVLAKVNIQKPRLDVT